MKRSLLLLLLSFLSGTLTLSAQDKEISKELYKAETIPDSLKDNANSVIRYSMTDITIKVLGKSIIKKHTIVTILNEKADNQAELILGYNKKYDSYSDIEMRVYDAKGNSLKKYHKGDMYDGSAANDETMVTNERFMAVKHTIASYPVTVEIQYEEDNNSFISPESWMIQERAEQAVEGEKCAVTVDPIVGFRYKDKNCIIKPVKSARGDMDYYYWEVNNLKAIKKEENVLPWKILPEVCFAVNTFDCYGYSGDFSSWKSFGEWIAGLNSNVCTLSPERTAEIKKMTDSIKSDKDKARFSLQLHAKEHALCRYSVRYRGLPAVPGKLC